MYSTHVPFGNGTAMIRNLVKLYINALHWNTTKVVHSGRRLNFLRISPYQAQQIMWQLFAILFANIQIIISSAGIERDLFENQFIFGDERENGRNAMKSPANKWPNGIVPYHFDGDYIERDKAAVLHAMEVFREKTCIKFIRKRDHHSEYIEFKKSKSGCGTLVGYKTDPINVFLSEKCLTLTGAIQHEIQHILGLWHEQSRPDRDEFVDILWDNIQPGDFDLMHLLL